jgi:Flp pilus assembly protein TadG
MTRRERHQRQEGAVAVIAAIMLVALMGVMALAFDVGNLYRVHTEEQSAVDSAALAGASALNGTPEGVHAAEDRAIRFGNEHVANGGDLTLGASNVVFGSWSAETGFQQLSNPKAMPNAQAVAAVQVYFESDVATPFASASGANAGQSKVRAQATAAGGGPTRIACGFPLVVPDCIDAVGGDGKCDSCLRASSANKDLMAWSAFGKGSGVHHISELVETACFIGGEVALDENGVCRGQCSNSLDLTVGADIDVNGGDNMSTSKQNYCGLIQRLLTRDDPEATPQPFRIEVPVIESGILPGSAACETSGLNGHMRIVGFTAIDILGAKCGKNDKAVMAVPAYDSACPVDPGSDKFIIASIARDAEGNCGRTSAPGGGRTFGVSVPVVLVQ